MTARFSLGARLPLALALAASTGLALARPPQTSPFPVYPMAPRSDADALADQMRVLGTDPNNINALLSAGELTLKLGDATAALAFFNRAQRIEPRNPRLEAGMAAVFVHTERPGEALKRFAAAEALGYPPARFAAERGLAYDLIGDTDRAQRDYRLALKMGADDEVTRRYALSLGIAGQPELAFQQLDTLLRREDHAAWRDRAFILAMNGDGAGAERIATSMMPPDLSAQMTAFFQRLGGLAPVDRAFAVHFGELRPTPERIIDARQAPVLAKLPPDPEAPRLAVVEPPKLKPAREDRRRGGHKKLAQTEVAAVPVPTAPPLPPPPSYPGATRPTQLAMAPHYAAPAPFVAPPRAPVPVPTPVRSPVPFQSPIPVVNPTRTPVAATPTPRATPAPIVPAAVAPIHVATPTPTPTPTPAPHPTPTSAPAAAPTPAPLPTPSAAPTPASATSAPSPLPQPTSTAPVAVPTPVPVPVATPSPSAGPIEVSASTPRAPIGAVEPGAMPSPVATPVPAPAEAAPGVPVAAAAPPPPPSNRQVGSEDTAVDRIVNGVRMPAAGREPGQPVAPPTPAAIPTPAPLATPHPAPSPRATPTPEPKSTPKPGKAAEAEPAEGKANHKKEAKKPAKPDPAKQEPARIWVQVAGGADEASLARAWEQVKKQAPAAFRGRQGWTTPLRATNRVLTGPFDSDAAAQEFVNTLRKEGVPTFQFTSTAGQKIAPLGAHDGSAKPERGDAETSRDTSDGKARHGKRAKQEQADASTDAEPASRHGRRRKNEEAANTDELESASKSGRHSKQRETEPSAERDSGKSSARHKREGDAADAREKTSSKEKGSRKRDAKKEEDDAPHGKRHASRH